MSLIGIKVDESTDPAAPPVGADQIGGIDYQVLKLAIGVEGELFLVPATGLPVSIGALPLPAGAAAESTLTALKTVTDNLLTAAQAIQTAAASLDGKATAINTGAIAGTVALDGATLAALETINVATNALPSGAATDASLVALNADLGDQADAAAGSDAGSFSLIALVKRLLGKFGVGQATMANSRPVVIASDQSAIPIAGSISAATDFWVSVIRALEGISEGLHIDPASGRLRVMLDATGGAQTLGTVTTVSTLSQIAGIPANSTVYDLMDAAWAQCIRPRIS